MYKIEIKTNPKLQGSSYFTYSYDGLGFVRVNECPAGIENWPRMVRAPAWVRHRIKTTVKI